jgi:hypothetical protein
MTNPTTPPGSPPGDSPAGEGWDAANPERAGLTPERKMPDGTPRPRFWMPLLRAAPIKRDMSRSAVEHARAKRQDRKTAKPYRSARQLAGDIAEANGEAETEMTEKGSEE